MSKIYLRDLELSCIIGCHAQEREQARKLILNIELEVDIRTASQSDNISDAINYWDVSEAVTRFVMGTEFHLLERLASEIASFILETFDVENVKVCIDKPGAVPNTKSVAVEFEKAK